MSPDWVVAGHALLAPLLALSQPPWSGMAMMLVRSSMILLFLLVLWVLLTLWWRRRARAAEAESRYFRDWLIPLLLAGLGLMLLCSRDRGSVDHLFQRVDNMLMNNRLTEVQPDVTPESWYDVLGIPAEDEEGEGAGAGVPFLPDRADLVTGETE
ncbi:MULTISPECIES: hypothetical protein [Lelliottia]|uniref:Uncharacterized protein n=1 Tax=Lelliottia aquatilis TaxID=2080838 RepID=A0ABX4ZVE3_9ENTR|nr:MULTISPECIES: hypothetical protein [Lelliottia]POZ13785.1 hypothetical protein C3Z09_21345 [Lelliottia aquatilis]POZ15215.1 hypothetical protein C3708_22530 [Lelliottia sp. 7254-16]POZ18954.1 hypothetical protein C3712_22375 [Lelliottia aquatilis]POZ20522.1 hypothetical protein C3711_22580 [Lelliottia aquatilis]POZ30553.1 hypothetical protein C3710_22085 [Lelliottia aquatilis]